MCTQRTTLQRGMGLKENTQNWRAEALPEKEGKIQRPEFPFQVQMKQAELLAWPVLLITFLSGHTHLPDLPSHFDCVLLLLLMTAKADHCLKECFFKLPVETHLWDMKSNSTGMTSI